MNKKLVLLLPLAMFIALVIVLWRQIGVDPQIVPQQTTGQPLPEMNLSSLTDQQQVHLANLPQQPFILNIWGSWCPTCAREQAYLTRLSSQGVFIVGINYKDNPAAALQFLASRGNPYRINLQDPAGDYAIDLGVTGAPESFVVDARHRIQKHIVGEVDQMVWQSQLAPCLQALAKGAVSCA